MQDQPEAIRLDLTMREADALLTLLARPAQQANPALGAAYDKLTASMAANGGSHDAT